MTFHAVRPEAVPVRLVATHAEGVPILGVTSTGDIRFAFRSSADCVAVDTGNSARVQSFGLFESETSAIKIISQVAGVTPVVSVGKSMLLMILKLRDYSSIPHCTS